MDYKVLTDIEFKKAEGKDRTFEATITKEVVDREGEVLKAEGLNPKNFLKTGTIFFNHNTDMPVGSCSSIKKSGNSWVAKAEIAQRPTDYQGEFFPDFVWAMLGKHVKGISVGFLKQDERKPSKKDVEDYGENVKNVITEWELLEYSIAPLQCNPDALVTWVSKGLISEAQAKQYFPDIDIPKPKAKSVKLYYTPQKRKQSKPNIERTIIKTVLKKRGQLYY